jgi:hypothetical protein
VAASELADGHGSHREPRLRLANANAVVDARVIRGDIQLSVQLSESQRAKGASPPERCHGAIRAGSRITGAFDGIPIIAVA